MALYSTSMGLLLFVLEISDIAWCCHKLIGPRVIRRGVPETLVLDIVDRVKVSVNATLILEGETKYSFPNVDASSPIEIEVQYDGPADAKNSNENKYVELYVIVNDYQDVIFQHSIRMLLVEGISEGYIHIQTDKPVYRPNERVKILIIALNRKQQLELARDVDISIQMPGKIAAMTLTKKAGTNFIETSYQLPEFPVHGDWSVSARYANEISATWSRVTFAVMPYVLPTFDVQLSLASSFINVRSNIGDGYIEGTITSKYVSEKPVSGSYFVEAKLKRPDFTEPLVFHQHPYSLDKSSFISGRQQFKIKVTELFRVLGKHETLDTLLDEGATITVEASVTAYADGTRESSDEAHVHLIRSPYKIDISRMSQYYSPGMAFEIKIDVLHSVSEKPMMNIGVVLADEKGKKILKAFTDANGQINEKINMDDSGKKEYKAIIEDYLEPKAEETSIKFSLYPQRSTGKEYLQLFAEKTVAEVGKNFTIEAFYTPTSYNRELRYLITSRGLIVRTGMQKLEIRDFKSTFTISITGDLAPSFRIFAYYMGIQEFISNSIWVDVEDACQKELQVIVPEQARPGEVVPVQIIGSPNATVAFSEVDRALLLLRNTGRLSREAVLQTLERNDMACFKEGGHDINHIFGQAGLQIAGMSIDTENPCQPAGFDIQRRKREVEEPGHDTKAFIDCKLEGMNDDEECSAQIRGSQACNDIYHKACMQLKQQRKLKKARRAAAANAGASSYKRLLSQPDGIWTTVQLDSDGKYDTYIIASPQSITTRQFDAVSVHPSDGLCVAKSQNMKVFKEVSIQLNAPYSLKYMHQTEIRASVFNYGRISRKIKVMVKTGEGICSHFQHAFSEVITFTLSANSGETISFVVLPNQIPDTGETAIEIKAYEGTQVLDHIIKMISVEPEGELRNIREEYSIHLKNKPAGAISNIIVDFLFPKNYVLGSRQCWISFRSDSTEPTKEQALGQSFSDIKNMLQVPIGNGEEIIASIGRNVYVHIYLMSVGEMKKGSSEEIESIERMKSGLTRQLRLRSTKYGVWSISQHREPSTWLNAYCNKVFSQARQIGMEMDMSPVCKSIAWLLTKQETDGSFNSGETVFDQKMHGAVGSKLSLTAYVLASLVESSWMCPKQNDKVAVTASRVMNYLIMYEIDRQMQQPYVLALVTYAVTISDPASAFANRLLERLLSLVKYSGNNQLAFWKGATLAQVKATNTHSYWYEHKPIAIDVEATAYGLLALIEWSRNEPTNVITEIKKKIALWLNRQKDGANKFTTLQETIVGLQALAKYMVLNNIEESSSEYEDFIVTLSGKDDSEWSTNNKIIHLNKVNNSFRIQVPHNVINAGQVEAAVKGSGDGTLSYLCSYRTISAAENCDFSISISTSSSEDEKPTLPGRLKPSILKLSVMLSKPLGLPSAQAIVDVNVIAGFEPIEESLQRLSRTYIVDGLIERYEIASQKVILHFAEITQEEVMFAFLLQEVVHVAAPEPSSVTVYTQKEPTMKCTQFYSRPGWGARLRTMCISGSGSGKERTCACAEGGCFTCRTRDEQLTDSACVPGMDEKCLTCENPSGCYDISKVACESEYMYVVQISKGIDDETAVFIEFEAEILTVYKRGSDVTAQTGKKITFTARTECFRTCVDPNLADEVYSEANIIEVGRMLLISGNNVDNIVDVNGKNTVRYHLDDKASVERIITAEKCKATEEKMKRCRKDKSRSRQVDVCKKIKAMSQSCTNMLLLRRMLIRGC